jgi:alpha-beta hydrolase superfamily lysophospholipase
MKHQKTKTLRYYIRWAVWILLFQFLLANISASIYAYKFTHFYDGPPPEHTSQNVFVKTWKLFVGPKFYKNDVEPAPSFPFESFKLKLANNTSIDAWYSQTDSSRGCVIMLHGLSMNKSSLLNEATSFKRWRYSILMIDFRGHGKSDGNNSCFGINETEEAQKAFEYAKQKGNRNIIIYGVSLGAVVAMKATAEKKIEPTAIIADAPFGNLHNHLKARSRALGFPGEPFGTLVTAWIGIEKGFNGFSHDANDYAKKINCPFLMECGERDRLVSVDEVKNVFDNLPSVTKKLVLYPEADHESYLLTDPVRWNNEVQAFLNSLPE